jgi:capsular polysaccharide biosynthesis protein
MEEINLAELFNYYLKKLPIIIVVTIIVAILGYFYVEKVQVPMYHGTTTIILVEKEDDKNSTVTQNDLILNEKLVSTYSEIIKSRRVLDQVIDDLNLKTNTNDLAEQVTVTAVSETSIIKVTVSNKNKKEAVIIANKVAEVFKKEITDIYNLENVSIIDNAIVENNPYNVNVKKQMVIYILVGIVLSCGIIFVMYYFDNTIKNKNEIEDKLNIPVLGEIPVAKKLTKKKKSKRNKRKKIINDDIRAKDINNEIFDNVDINIIEEEKPTKKKTTTKKATTKKKTSTTASKKKESTTTNRKTSTTTKKRTTKAKKEEEEK